MKKEIALILITALGLFLFSCKGHKDDEIEKLLQTELANKKLYQQEKEKRIKVCTDSLLAYGSKISVESKYRLYDRLYGEYILFKFDSAYHYSSKMKEIADEMKSPYYFADSRIKYCQALYNAGYYKEVIDSLAVFKVEKHTHSAKQVSSYSFLFGRTYQMLAEHSMINEYSEKYNIIGNQFLQAALESTNDSLMIYTIQARIASRKMDYEKAKVLINKAIGHLAEYDDRAASLYTMLAKIKGKEGNIEEALKYNSMAAIIDIKKTTKDGLPLINIANILIKDENRDNNKLELASSYLDIALDDARQYGALQRIKQIDTILPVIEAEQLIVSEKNKNTLTVLVIVITVLLLMIVVAFILSVKQSKKLSVAKKMLQETNKTLSESNMIKNEYLGHYLEENSKLSDALSRLNKVIKRCEKSKNYSEISSFLEKVWVEKENLHEDFDQIFLKIFPNFIDEFNRLVEDSAKIEVTEPSTLTPTLRIFALIRLDINDSTTISKILNCSLNTVYNYRTRIKNKAIVDKNKFETYVKEIDI